jgi:regulator of sigma E protease
MTVLEYLWDWVLPFLLVLTVLVFVHELGHFWVARRSGVRVETFSIGFGPELFGWYDRAGTRWKFSAVPLGGYVKMFGEFDFAPEDERPQLTPDEQSVSFHHKSLRQRAAIVAAGPIANFLFAIVLLVGLFTIAGSPRPLAGVGTVQDNSAAAAAGLQTGDRILRVDGEPVVWFDDIRSQVSGKPGIALVLDVQRGESEISLTATPRPEEVDDGAGGRKVIGLLGIAPDPGQVDYERLGPIEAAGEAVDRTIGLSWQILSTIGQVISGSRTTEDLGGPLRIAQLSGQMAQDGVVNMIFFMAALSINLGLINLLPVPMLDGGHLTFYAIEALRGKPVDKKVQEYGFRFGLVFVIFIMVLATWNDLIQLRVVDFFKQLIS